MSACAVVGGVVLLGAVAACSSSPAVVDPNAPDPTGSDDPDLELRTAVVTAEAKLIATYDAVIAKFPDLADQLKPFRAHHAAHLAAVNIGQAIAAPTPAAPAVPSSSNAALRQLAKAEGAAATAREADCLHVSRWQFARELSLIGACESAHQSLLARELG